MQKEIISSITSDSTIKSVTATNDRLEVCILLYDERGLTLHFSGVASMQLNYGWQVGQVVETCYRTPESELLTLIRQKVQEDGSSMPDFISYQFFSTLEGVLLEVIATSLDIS